MLHKTASLMVCKSMAKIQIREYYPSISFENRKAILDILFVETHNFATEPFAGKYRKEVNGTFLAMFPVVPNDKLYKQEMRNKVCLKFYNS